MNNSTNNNNNSRAATISRAGFSEDDDCFSFFHDLGPLQEELDSSAETRAMLGTIALIANNPAPAVAPAKHNSNYSSRAATIARAGFSEDDDCFSFLHDSVQFQDVKVTA